MGNQINVTWTPANVSAFRDFIAHNQQFLDYLTTRKPKSEGDSLEKAALNARLRDGFDLAISELKAMAEFTPELPTGGEFIDTDKN